MRRATMLLLVLMAVLLFGQGLADAKPRRYRPGHTRVVRTTPPHRHVVRHHPVRYVYRGGVWVAVPAPYPVYTETVVVAPAPEPIYVEEPPLRRIKKKVKKVRYHRDVGLLLKLGGTAYGSASANLQTDDLAVGSIGAAVRWHFDPHWAMELSAEWASGSDRQYRLDRTVTPLSASLVLNLLPRSALNLYGLAGVGLQLSEVRAVEYGYRERYSRPTAHLGAGVEMRLSPALRLFSDMRFIGLAAPLDEDVSGSDHPPPTWLVLQEGDQAVQFTAGMGVFF